MHTLMATIAPDDDDDDDEDDDDVYKEGDEEDEEEEEEEEEAEAEAGEIEASTRVDVSIITDVLFTKNAVNHSPVSVYGF